MLASLVLLVFLLATPQQVHSQQISPQITLCSRLAIICYLSAAQNNAINDDISAKSSSFAGTIDDAPPKCGNVRVEHDDNFGKQLPADSDSANYLNN